MTAYRHTLRRDFAPLIARRIVWVMLNPSTADDTVDDPTIRKCIGFSSRAGFGSLSVVNLWPMRATDPADLRRATWAERLGDPAAADDAIRKALTGADAVVPAWGANGALYPDRVRQVMAIVNDAPAEMLTLGGTQRGHPKHPLMVGYEPGLQAVYGRWSGLMA